MKTQRKTPADDKFVDATIRSLILKAEDLKPNGSLVHSKLIQFRSAAYMQLGNLALTCGDRLTFGQLQKRGEEYLTTINFINSYEKAIEEARARTNIQLQAYGSRAVA